MTQGDLFFGGPVPETGTETPAPTGLTRREFGKLLLAGPLLVALVKQAPARSVDRAHVMDFMVAGNRHSGLVGQAALDALQPGDAVRLEPEPNNPLDPRAITVFCTMDGHKLGYVPRSATAPLHAALAEGKTLHAHVTRRIYPQLGREKWPDWADGLAITDMRDGDPVINVHAVGQASAQLDGR